MVLRSCCMKQLINFKIMIAKRKIRLFSLNWFVLFSLWQLDLKKIIEDEQYETICVLNSKGGQIDYLNFYSNSSIILSIFLKKNCYGLVQCFKNNYQINSTLSLSHIVSRWLAKKTNKMVALLMIREFNKKLCMIWTHELAFWIIELQKIHMIKPLE